jgi:hypothetical protein
MLYIKRNAELHASIKYTDYLHSSCFTLACACERTEFWWGNLTEADHLKHPGVNEKIMLKQIVEKWDGGHGRD